MKILKVGEEKKMLANEVMGWMLSRTDGTQINKEVKQIKVLKKKNTMCLGHGHW